MTTLVLFNSESRRKITRSKSAIDWGTGKERSHANNTRPPSVSGSFLYTGEPISQTYKNTDLSLSNVRINDELVPAPLHTTNMANHEIPLEFPSNHPFTSHVCQKSMFPTASIDLNDRPSTCTDPYVVTHKIRGNPFRREVHYYGLQKERCRTSKWPDKHYMQLPRTLSNIESSSSSIYPYPRKMLAPNYKSKIKPSTFNTAKPKVKCQPVNMYQDNCASEAKLNSQTVSVEGKTTITTTTATVASNEQLKPQHNNTVDSSKPMEFIDKNENDQQENASERSKTVEYPSSTETMRNVSEHERLDDHLLNGTDYVNLPSHMYRSVPLVPTWIHEQDTCSVNQYAPHEVRFLRYNRPSTTVGQLARDHYASHQQVHAENRLQELEVIRPVDNLNLLNAKFQNLQHPRHARPILPQYRDDYVNTLYNQMSTYVQERSGLYHTDTYDPNTLTQAIPELANPIEDQTPEVDRFNHEIILDTMEQNQQRPRAALFQGRAIGDYRNMRSQLLNGLRVPDNAATVDSRTQEGNKTYVQRDSIYGQAYNTRIFLQENTLLPNARSDPTCLMSSKYNTNLERVRSFNSCPIKVTHNQPLYKHNQDTDNKNLVSPIHRPAADHTLYTTQSICEHTDGYTRRATARVYDSPFKSEHSIQSHNKACSHPLMVKSQTTTLEPVLTVPPQLTRSAKTTLRLSGPEVVARFAEPNISPHTTYQRSFKDFSYHETIPNKQSSTEDNKQSSARSTNKNYRECQILDLQDQWSKTQARQKYNMEHPEVVPDVGGCTIRAKKEILLADTLAKRGMMTVR